MTTNPVVYSPVPSLCGQSALVAHQTNGGLPRTALYYHSLNQKILYQVNVTSTCTGLTPRMSWRQKVERSVDFVDFVGFDFVASVQAYWAVIQTQRDVQSRLQTRHRLVLTIYFYSHPKGLSFTSVTGQHWHTMTLEMGKNRHLLGSVLFGFYDFRGSVRVRVLLGNVTFN